MTFKPPSKCAVYVPTRIWPELNDWLHVKFKQKFKGNRSMAINYAIAYTMMAEEAYGVDVKAVVKAATERDGWFRSRQIKLDEARQG